MPTLEEIIKIEDPDQRAEAFEQYKRKCINDVVTSTMRPGESIRKFHERLSAAVTRTESALINIEFSSLKNLAVYRSNFELLTLKVFINALPEGWKIGVIAADPKNIDEALDIVLGDIKSSYKEYNAYTNKYKESLH